MRWVREAGGHPSWGSPERMAGSGGHRADAVPRTATRGQTVPPFLLRSLHEEG